MKTAGRKMKKISTRDLPDFTNFAIKNEGGEQGARLYFCCGVRIKKNNQSELEVVNHRR